MELLKVKEPSLFRPSKQKETSNLHQEVSKPPTAIKLKLANAERVSRRSQQRYKPADRDCGKEVKNSDLCRQILAFQNNSESHHASNTRGINGIDSNLRGDRFTRLFDFRTELHSGEFWCPPESLGPCKEYRSERIHRWDG
ncbi:hypothetical protein CDAR_97731 [Caerostris darwini]|uniref:Uncharacterized protein n=1 Tax=Caerostris darwini TaxID=1538125 RepID=A0AAV4STX5_9ARAC|nr:hypothetical protein CDAR_97731 [Caerostris darwini]